MSTHVNYALFTIKLCHIDWYQKYFKSCNVLYMYK